MMPDGPLLAHIPLLLRPHLLSPSAALQNLKAGSRDSESLAGPRDPFPFRNIHGCVVTCVLCSYN